MDQDCSNVNSLWMARKSGYRILMQSNILSFNKLIYVKQGFCHYGSLSYMFAGDEVVSVVNSKQRDFMFPKYILPFIYSLL